MTSPLRISKKDPIKGTKFLNFSTKLWFIIAVIGQWLFVYYIAKSYGGKALNGNAEAWSEGTIKGHVAGDDIGNAMFAFHLIFAIVLTIGGTLQLIPQIRQRALKFHRYNGRVFIFTAYVMSLGGLYLVWIRGAILSLNGGIAISLNAILILIFATLAIKTARKRNIKAHQKWALRAFIVVNGVWFFRVGFMAWILINQAPVGSTENLDGPFDLVWAYLNYLLPLLILELYLFARDHSAQRVKYFTAVVLILSSIITAVGIFGAYLMMWGPAL